MSNYFVDLGSDQQPSEYRITFSPNYLGADCLPSHIS